MKKNRINIHSKTRLYLEGTALILEDGEKAKYSFYEIEHSLVIWLDVIEKSRKNLK
jgi:hypothetical protein